MSFVFPHIFPNINDWPINKFAEQRPQFISELNELVFKRLKNSDKQSLEDILAKTIYLELQRIKTQPWKVDPQNELEYWRDISNTLTKSLKSEDKEEKLEKLTKRIINRYNEEIVGSFNPGTFRFARKFLTFVFKVVFNKFSAKGQSIFWGKKTDLLQKIKITGYVEETRNLFSKGTVVIVPTHFSNIDSVMIGYACDMLAGLPQFSYGAGLNLFNSEFVAYFINRLGAYRIDRRKKNPIYLECLTSMASYSLFKKLNNIFFPGGTRSRSGAMEDKLKYGLLGSAIDAQRMIFEQNSDNKIFIVPLVMSYNFVFEAKPLIDQHLMAIGKEKYQRTKEYPTSKFKFLKLFFKKQSEVILSFGEPMDIVGNKVDENGRSLDKNCNIISLKDYFILQDKLEESAQREAVYTRILADKILNSYFKNNVVLASHLSAFVAFQILLAQRKDLNLFAILRLHPKEFSIDYDEFKSIFKEILTIMKEMERDDKINLAAELHMDTDYAIEYGLETLGSYHVEKVLGYNKEKQLIYSEHLRLLYFYSNRLIGYGLENMINWERTIKFRYLDKIKERE